MAVAGRQVPGAIDTIATVRLAARRTGSTRVLRHGRSSVARGLQLHVQQSSAFVPFLGDVAGLRAACRAVISSGSFDEVSFDRDPRHIVGPLRRVRRLSAGRHPVPVEAVVPKPPGTVVCVTDFGIGRNRDGSSPSPPMAWLEHHDTMVSVGARVVYLVPYPVDRWPRELRELPAVFWTDGLRSGDTLAAMRRRPR